MFKRRADQDNLIATLSELKIEIKHLCSGMNKVSKEVAELRHEFRADHEDFNDRLTTLEVEFKDSQRDLDKKQSFNFQVQIAIITALVGLGLPQVLGLFHNQQAQEKSASEITSASKIFDVRP